MAYASPAYRRVLCRDLEALEAELELTATAGARSPWVERLRDRGTAGTRAAAGGPPRNADSPAPARPGTRSAFAARHPGQATSTGRLTGGSTCQSALRSFKTHPSASRRCDGAQVEVCSESACSTISFASTKRRSASSGSMARCRRAARLVFERGDSAAALVFDRDANVLLFTEQFRFPAYRRGEGGRSRLMAGMVEEGETPDATSASRARRRARLSRRRPRAGGDASSFPRLARPSASISSMPR